MQWGTDVEKSSPIILWFRRDFRLADHPALAEARRSGRSVIPVFILDEVAESYGAAPKWRLAEALTAFEHSLQKIGSRLVLRRGNAAETLLALARETGAQDIWWTRAYDPEAIERDTKAKQRLKSCGYEAKSFPGHILFEPWTVGPKPGEFYKVYSPMWRAVRNRFVSAPEPAPQDLRAPDEWPQSANLQDWRLQEGVSRGGQFLKQYACVGEEKALLRFAEFLASRINGYRNGRDFPANHATSQLSENLAWGEIGPRTIWHAGMRALLEGSPGAEHFLKELVWREFSYQLVFHTPRITTENWRPEWDAFPWSEEDDEAVLRWKQGRTGVPIVDAAMREMFVTGHMHNRGRMIAGSYLTKHMMTHWRVGQKWFEECLIDWDPAANALGWQWVAGSGPDASPYFRIFNPETQAAKFDPDSKYIHRFVAELVPNPPPEALAYFEACPRCWNLSSNSDYPKPIVGISEGRFRALEAYQSRGWSAETGQATPSPKKQSDDR
ncbi:MAG: deoxyribodipyrimidine photo-lyase [Sphingomonadales bacterium]|nr:MAG: deoxyribodipyrimidine photo-lyase [Sphingomonadales bacterium]